MRVLIYSEYFFPSVGGVESFNHLIAHYLQEMGVEVTVVTQTIGDGGQVLPFRVERRPSTQTLARLVENCDLIYMNGFHFSLFLCAKLKRKKVVFTYHDLSPICPKGTKWKGDGPCLDKASLRVCVPCLKKSGQLKIFNRLLRPFLKSFLSLFIDANVCTSNFGMERYSLWRKRLILNGVDITKFIPKFSYSTTGLLPQVVFVGRLIPEKGCQVLIEALHKSVAVGTPFQLAICGDGPYMPQLQALVQSYGLKSLVHFFGELRDRALLEVMQIADVAVVPSLWDEVFGLTAIEAMSCGLPVVAANVGGLGGIVAEAGFTFERGDSLALATHLQRLLNDQSLREEVGRKARQLVVEKYDWRIMCERYYRLFIELVGNGR